MNPILARVSFVLSKKFVLDRSVGYARLGVEVNSRVQRLVVADQVDDVGGYRVAHVLPSDGQHREKGVDLPARGRRKPATHGAPQKYKKLCGWVERVRA